MWHYVTLEKMVLYARSILDNLNAPQHTATILFEDNRGALLMSNQRQPAKMTRHMDIKNFEVSKWVEKILSIYLLSLPLTMWLMYLRRKHHEISSIGIMTN